MHDRKRDLLWQTRIITEVYFFCSASLWRIRMTAHPPMANRCCVDRAYHIRLIRSNRLCYYWSSHTFLITDLFVAYHTYLVYVKCFCSLGSTQTVYRNELYALHCTHLDLAVPFLLRCLIENSSPKWTVCRISHIPWSGWPFLLCCLITNSSSEWTVCSISHTPSSSARFFCSASSQTVCWTEPYALDHTRN